MGIDEAKLDSWAAVLVGRLAGWWTRTPAFGAQRTDAKRKREKRVRSVDEPEQDMER